MTAAVIPFLSSFSSWKARRSLFCFQAVLSRKTDQNSFWKLLLCCLLMICRFPSSRDTMHSQRTRLNFLGQDWMKSLSHLRANDWNIWKREILFAHCQKIVFASNVRSQKILKKWIHYLPSNRVNCRFVPASQSKTSISDRKEQILHLDTCRLPLINISPKFALMKQVVLKVDRTESTVFSNSNKIRKCFWIASLFTWFVEGLPLIRNVVFYRISDTQYLHLEQSRDF